MWVLDHTQRILAGEVSQVVKGLLQSVAKRDLSGAKRSTLLGVTHYHPMDFPWSKDGERIGLIRMRRIPEDRRKA